MVLGPMEHILWEVIGREATKDDTPKDSDKAIDMDATAAALSDMLWSAIAAPGAELAALRHLRRDVAAALDKVPGGAPA
jgi:hypothetical protein